MECVCPSASPQRVCKAIIDGCYSMVLEFNAKLITQFSRNESMCEYGFHSLHDDDDDYAEADEQCNRFPLKDQTYIYMYSMFTYDDQLFNTVETLIIDSSLK